MQQALYASAFVVMTTMHVPTAAIQQPAAVIPAETALDPVESEKIRYINPATGDVSEVPWVTLTEVQKRELLPNAEAFIQLRQRDSSGGLQFLPISVSHKKGSYQLLFRWQQYRADYCLASNPQAGRIRTGVALEIIAEIESKKSGLNLANLGALTAAAERQHVSGQILIRQIGLGNYSPTLGTYMANFSLTREGVTKALEAIAVTKAVLENLNNKLTPHFLSTIESSPGACTQAKPAAAKPI